MVGARTCIRSLFMAGRETVTVFVFLLNAVFLLLCRRAIMFWFLLHGWWALVCRLVCSSYLESWINFDMSRALIRLSTLLLLSWIGGILVWSACVLSNRGLDWVCCLVLWRVVVSLLGNQGACLLACCRLRLGLRCAVVKVVDDVCDVSYFLLTATRTIYSGTRMTKVVAVLRGFLTVLPKIIWLFSTLRWLLMLYRVICRIN